MDMFKQCSCCDQLWGSKDDFLSDPKVAVIGYQSNFESLNDGLFYFNHLACLTTFAIKTQEFRALYDGPVYRERATGTEKCPQYCLQKDNLLPCLVKCECAYIRSILQRIKAWPKLQSA